MKEMLMNLMKLSSVAFALLLPVALAGRAATAAAPVEATLTLPYETVLPGVPFDMTVTLKNTSDSPVTVGISARLVVTLSDGRDISRRPWETMLGPRDVPSNLPSIELGPRESRQFFVDWQGYMPNFFHDPDFSGPGVYGLTFHLATYERPDNYVGEIVTTTAQLTRTVPPGEDEALWKRMTAAMDGRWADDSLCNSNSGAAILREILQIHPASAYYPYAVVLARELDLRDHKAVSKDDIRKALEAAERFRSSPAHSHLLVQAGDVAGSVASFARLAGDYKTFFEYFALAEQYYATASRATTIPAVRAAAESGKQSARMEMENQRQRDAGTYGKVKQ
jgi:hypothetical protein